MKLQVVSCLLAIGFLLLQEASAATKLINKNVQTGPGATDKLVKAIQSKKFEAVSDELQSADPDQPDSKGRLPLIEAVKTKDAAIVDALIQYGALINVKDPATGVTPLHVAFQTSSAEVAKVLLKYGGDPNIEDKSGKKARETVPTMELRKMLEDFDKDQWESFEDVPGTWTKAKDDAGQEYWFNIKTQETRWNKPPSCAWTRVELMGHPFHYQNTVTGQEETRVPQALAWRKVKYEGKDMWYNWKINASQIEVPAELPEDLLEELEGQTNWRWINSVTGELSWEDPRHHNPWRKLETEDRKDDDPEFFYYNVVSGESQWEEPEELAWQEFESTEHPGRKYYSKEGDEPQWEKPQHLAWELVEDEL